MCVNILAVQPKIYTSQEHHIRHELIDPHALTVLQKLQAAGHTAYLVGGGVRDLLLRKKPKDFDISTSAKPEDIKALFRNCLLIGRRFRLAHIRFGRHIIEVSTFRSGDPTHEDLILRDNIWGSPEEDVLRRDFTINGLFYDPLDHKIIDYVGGFEDLKHHYLRVIGNPLLRFKQDPVRMIRMQKFRARFGFHPDPEALEALLACRQEIMKSSPARVLEEMLRMLESGAAAPFFHLLLESGMLELLFPTLNRYLKEPLGEEIFAYLKAADAMNTQGQYKTLDRSLLVSTLLFPILDHEIKTRFDSAPKKPHLGQVINLAYLLIHELLCEAFSHFPKRIRMGSLSILQTQYRLTPLDSKKRPRTRIVHQRDFILALTFLKLRALIHPELFKIYEHWKKLMKEGEAPHAQSN